MANAKCVSGSARVFAASAAPVVECPVSQSHSRVARRGGGMTLYKNATYDNYRSEGMFTNLACEVVLRPKELVVSYYEDGQHFVYRGPETGAGHYLLHCVQNGGKAEMHHMPDTDYINGWWHENGEEGMWRIFLDDPEAAKPSAKRK